MVGYITIISGKFKKVRETAYILVGVLASHQRQGIGTGLLRAAEEYVRERGMHRIELEVAAESGAVRLYEKLGYVAEGRRREAIRAARGYTDMIWMGKLLDSDSDRKRSIAPTESVPAEKQGTSITTPTFAKAIAGRPDA